MKHTNLHHQDGKLVLDGNANIQFILIRDIIDIIYDRPYSVVTIVNNNHFLLYQSLNKVLLLLDDNFIRCNKSVIVNLLFVNSYSKRDGLIKMNNGEEFIISFRRRASVQRQLSSSI